MPYKDLNERRRAALRSYYDRKKRGALHIHELTCKWCRAPFKSIHKTRAFCSRSCSSKHNAAKNPLMQKGRPATVNKGGTIHRGYRYLFLPTHPMAGRNGYVAEHRLKMAELLERPLRRDEIVHHKDGNRLNNRTENLEIIDHKTHGKRHHAQQVRCPVCEHVFRVADHPRL